MANRITIYGRTGEVNTKRIQKELGSMSLNYNFFDIAKQPQSVTRLTDAGVAGDIFPKVEITSSDVTGAVYLTNPDTETLKSTLYSEEVLGVTSYWV